MAQTVAGVVPFTSIDFPGYLATVIFFLQSGGRKHHAGKWYGR